MSFLKSLSGLSCLSSSVDKTGVEEVAVEKNLTVTKKKPAEVLDPKRFTEEEGIWSALALNSDGATGPDVRLLRATWLVKLADEGGTLAQRKELPEEAFISTAELKEIHKKSSAIPSFVKIKRLPIIVVSHFWRTKPHPDPEGVTLRHFARAYKLHIEQYSKYGIAEMGVFWDWVSLFQELRSEEELAAFKRSLKLINLWYAHALTTVYLVTDEVPGIVPYFDRGWCCFEYAVSTMAKLGDMWNVWPQVIQIRTSDVVRPKQRPPAAPDAFYPGGEFGEKVFTNGADRSLVAEKFEEATLTVLGAVKNLGYEDLGWGDKEMESLFETLSICKSIERISLDKNPFTTLPASVGKIKSLGSVSCWNCPNLTTLPESLGDMPKLYRLHCGSCNKLNKLPASLAASSVVSEVYLPKHMIDLDHGSKTLNEAIMGSKAREAAGKSKVGAGVCATKHTAAQG